jgi:hypothetical protein
MNVFPAGTLQLTWTSDVVQVSARTLGVRNNVQIKDRQIAVVNAKINHGNACLRIARRTETRQMELAG